MVWQQIALAIGTTVEGGLDWLKRNILHRNGHLTPVRIIPYMGYGTAHSVHLRGRVVQNHRVRRAKVGDSRVQNLLNIYHRFESDEIPFAQVSAQIGDTSQTLTCDDEAYFVAHLQPQAALDSAQIWHDLHLSYDDGDRQAQAVGKVLIPPPDARYGVISDLDDTVIYTGVTNLVRLAYNVFLRNAHTRTAFSGVAAFYQALQAGAQGGFNPIFYVSNSPWNLYDLLTHFFTLRNIPMGPIFLRDFGLTASYLVASSEHKFQTIEHLLTLYPKLPFILIGDSGEKDPDIYLQIVQAFPGRIAAVYIRDVEPQRRDTQRDQHVAQVAVQMRAAGSELVMIADSYAAAKHAAERGFISSAALPEIERACADEAG